MKPRNLFLKQLDRQLTAWSASKIFFQPQTGWVNCLRRALGMTLPQLASRLGVSRSRVIRIQQDELSGALTISTLKEVAEALNCDLLYAFVPRKPLRQLLEERAKKIAKQKLQTVSHSMTLEDQKVELKHQQEQLEDLINTLLSNNPKHLWETN